jgi:hypothetical protein
MRRARARFDAAVEEGLRWLEEEEGPVVTRARPEKREREERALSTTLHPLSSPSSSGVHALAIGCRAALEAGRVAHLC